MICGNTGRRYEVELLFLQCPVQTGRGGVGGGGGGGQGEREAQRHTYEEIIACAIALRPFVSALK